MSDEHRTQSLDIPIPALSGLRGASIYAQSLHNRMPGDNRLGNVCTATIR